MEKLDAVHHREGPEALGEVVNRDAHGAASGSRETDQYFFFSSSATDSISLRNVPFTCS